jgi:hypothetical protein
MESVSAGVRSAGVLVVMGVLAAGAGLVPDVLSTTGTLLVAGIGIALVAPMVLRRALGASPARIASGPPAVPDRPHGGVVARYLFYCGVFTVGFPLARPAAGLTVSELFFLAAFSVCALDVLRGHPIAPVRPGVIIGTLVFAVGASVSSLHAANRFGSLFQTAHGVYVMLLWAWLGAMVLRTPRHFKIAIALWVVSLSLDGVGALAQLAGLHTLMGPASGHRATAFTAHPNDLGGASAAALVPALALATIAMRSGRRPAAAVTWILVGLIVCGVMLSGSVGATAGVAVATLMWLSSPTVRSPSRVAVAVIVLAGVLVVAFAGAGVPSPVRRLNAATSTSGSPGSGSGTERLSILKVTWPRIVRSPVVGVGLDAASATVYIVSVTGEAVPYLPHGLPLAAWYEAGILGLIGILLVLAGLVGAAHRGVTQANTAEEHMIAWAFSCALAAGFVYLMTAPMAFQQYAWLAAVMLAAWSYRPGTVQSPAWSRPGLAPAVLGPAAS